MLAGIENATLMTLSACGFLSLTQLARSAFAARRLGRIEAASTFSADAAISLVRPVCGLASTAERFSHPLSMLSARLGHCRCFVRFWAQPFFCSRS